jgi:hypothetical protein
MPRTISPAQRANQITFILKGHLKNVQVSYIRAASDIVDCEFSLLAIDDSTADCTLCGSRFPSRVTPRAHRPMSALLTFRQVHFPQTFAAAA